MPTATDVVRIRNRTSGHVFEFSGTFRYPGLFDRVAGNKAEHARQQQERNKHLLGKLPYEVKKQVDDGSCEELGPDDAYPDAEPWTPPAASQRPPANGSHEAWIGYAISQGMPRSEASELSRNALRDRFTDTGFDPDARPNTLDDL